jgi:hypothetical protein
MNYSGSLEFVQELEAGRDRKKLYPLYFLSDYKISK